MALLQDNNFYLTKCYSVQMSDLPNSGFLETDNDGIIVSSQYNKFTVFPKSWSIFSNMLVDIPVNLTADPTQFFGFYTEPDLGSSESFTTQVDINISAGFYNLYVLCYVPLNYSAGIILSIGSKSFSIIVNGTNAGNNIISSSNALEIDASGQYAANLTVGKTMGLTQVWLTPYNPPTMMALPETITNLVVEQPTNVEPEPINLEQPINYIYLPPYQN